MASKLLNRARRSRKTEDKDGNVENLDGSRKQEKDYAMAPHDLTRRELLALAGSAAAAGLLGCGSAAAGSTTSSPTSPTPTAGSCVMTPQLTEG
ncbi:MAG: hypothetical protein DMF85_18400, partial [Acidobacteria bacterium]